MLMMIMIDELMMIIGSSYHARRGSIHMLWWK